MLIQLAHHALLLVREGLKNWVLEDESSVSHIRVIDTLIDIDFQPFIRHQHLFNLAESGDVVLIGPQLLHVIIQSHLLEVVVHVQVVDGCRCRRERNQVYV